MANVSNRSLLTGNITRNLLRMALPLMLFNLVSVIYSFVDTFWVGQIGELQVGAISIVSTINLCGTAFVTGLSAAGMALMSKAVGAGDMKRANHVATVLLNTSMIIALFISLAVALFGKPILNWLNTPADIYDDTYQYLLGLAPDFIFIFILTIFQAIRQSCGDSRSGVMLNIIAAILNCLLDPLLIFGLNLSMFGASLATTLSKLLVCPVAFYVMLKDLQAIHIDYRRYHFDKAILKEIVTVGLPASTGSFLLEFGFMIMNRYIVSYGSMIMSAYGLGNRISSLFYIPVNGLATALTPFIGQAIGAKNYPLVHKCYRDAMKLGLVVSALTTALGMLFARPMGHFLVRNASAELMSNALTYAYYSIGTTVFMAWMNNLLSVFNGSGETSSSLMMNVIRLWAYRIPLLMFFKNYTALGPLGIWLAMIISNLLICLTGQTWYLLYFRRKYPAV